MLSAKKDWVSPDLTVFGDLAALTLTTNTNEGPPGGGTGSDDTGQCNGKGCNTGDTLTSNLNGFS